MTSVEKVFRKERGLGVSVDDARSAWIQTYTGKAFFPLDPKAEDVDIHDIAHALAMQCRFTGHVRRFYSVAEHSLLVSFNVPRRDALWGLLHDASEAYLVDLCRPLKRYSDMGARYREIESRVMAAIVERFGLVPWEPESVSIADRRMLMTEKRDLLGPEPIRWTHTDEPYPFQVLAYTPDRAEAMFLSRFEELRG